MTQTLKMWFLIAFQKYLICSFTRLTDLLMDLISFSLPLPPSPLVGKCNENNNSRKRKGYFGQLSSCT